jgi:hypothetical protein
MRLMTKKIEPWQAKKILEEVRPSLAYLNRLLGRMDEVGFLATDPLYNNVTKARDATHRLWVELHYLSCSSGVGRPSPPSE